MILLYKLGVIRHLTDFDSHGADAPIGLGSYSATPGLAAMDGQDRAEEHPLIPLVFPEAYAALPALRRGS